MENDKDFITKFIDLQQEFVASKTEKNEFGNYNYRNIEVMLHQLKPLLLERGFYITFNDDLVQEGDRYYIKATVIISDGKNILQSSALAREELEKKKSDASQLTGSASTYARKYALSGLLGVDDSTNDPDSKNNDRSQYTAPKTAQAVSSKLATEKQWKTIFAKAKEMGLTEKQEVLNMLEVDFAVSDTSKLTIADASEIIGAMIGDSND
jgi:hypothetical protein